MKNIKKLAKNPILELCVTLTKNCSTPVVISNVEKRWLLKCLEQHKTSVPVAVGTYNRNVVNLTSGT